MSAEAKVELSEEKKAAIEAKREAARQANKPRIEGKTYKKICPACDKPNALEVDFCTGCSFSLVDWDIELVPDNIFLELVQGKDIGTIVHHRCEKYLVFNDKFGVSKYHVDVIPCEVFADVSALNGSHVTMLEEMYQLGLQHMRNQHVDYLQGHDLEDVLVAGYNFPVSVKHLHLHMVLPPFTHEKVFQYPRWHSHAKVVRDLREHGRVIPYQEAPNDEEGAAVYNKAIHYSRLFSQPASL
eukprot:TRINITY_DN1943_c0_g1_i1.p1 TRINITY_DN1943_c0_g1~~TRINITY_DN1943_c0_g1_i1.p1  ORF type:complete len:241 (-),score=76.83 TRINITY_DN1943_c0_g1_i1:77-799(-)